MNPSLLRPSLIACAVLASLCPTRSRADTFPELGGVVVDAYEFFVSRHVGSPSITIMGDGTYIASHDEFGASASNDTTFVFRSTDQGRTWVRASVIRGAYHSTVFFHRGALYLIGPRGNGDVSGGGPYVIRKSLDRGTTWSGATIIQNDSGGSTPNSPVVHAGRLWIARGKQVFSAPEQADLMRPESWAVTRMMSAPEGSLDGTITRWNEGQIVASPDEGVFFMPKIDDRPFSALVRVDPDDFEQLTFNSDNDDTPGSDYVPLPGADKKFAVLYDSVSKGYYALTNPVLAAHGGYDAYNPSMIRNTAALLFSRDLRSWTVRRIFLYSPDVEGEGFQYLQAAIDGDDLVIVSRTAIFDASRALFPARAHDANVLSFHRLPGFRQAWPVQALVADTNANRVLRYEVTLTSRLAPLGSFTSTPLRKPMGIATPCPPFGFVECDSDVYISEQVEGGRVMRFSKDGQLEETVAVSGEDFTGYPESLAFPEGFQPDRLYMSSAFGSGADKIYVMDRTTEEFSLFVGSSFSSAAGSGTLKDPRGLAVVDDELYVADRENNRIRKFSSDGTFLGDLTTTQRRPQALAWESLRGRLLFSRKTTESDIDIARVTLSGSIRTLYTEGGIGSALGILPADDRVFWTDYDRNRIYMLDDEDAKTKVVSVQSGLNGPGSIVRVFGEPSLGR